MSGRPGVSLVELIVSLAIFSVLLVTTLAFYHQQGAAFNEGNDRMTVMQNLRYGVNTVEQNVRTAGTGVPSKQPVIVYADSDVIAFNADYASNIANDFFAVFYDSRLPDDAVTAVTPSRAFVIPMSGFTYPDSAYYQGAANSPAETITLFFRRDTTTTRTDDYVLYRQANDLAPDVVARRILATDRPFFTYYRVDPGGGGSPIAAIAPSKLPAAHTVPVHGSVADTGAVALVDSIHAVRISYAATDGMNGSEENLRKISRLIRLPNAGMETQPNCGNSPLLGTSLVAAAYDGPGGFIRLQWGQATDEVTGERDVIRYVLWRRTGTSGPWGDPLVSVSPGSSIYVYDDNSAAAGVTYSYALAAQDCTPQYSPMSVTGGVTWVNP